MIPPCRRATILSGQKILVTGPAGRIAFGLARALARDNEVWGIARFTDPAQRAAVERLGVITRPIDLHTGDFEGLPRDFTHLLHLAAALEHDYERMFRINGEGTGLLLEHCRTAKAALVMSTVSVYRPQPEPYFRYAEGHALGEASTNAPAPYSISKISQEIVARYCARSLGLPVTIARMNAAYGPHGGRLVWDLAEVVAGRPVVTRNEPFPYTPIFEDDIVGQVEALLDAASVPATIVNWGGDEIVTAQQWTAYMGELLCVPASVRIETQPGWPAGMVSDNTKRLTITGPGRVSVREGVRRLVETLYPDRILNGSAAISTQAMSPVPAQIA